MNFSLKEVISQSAMQLKYLRDNPSKKMKPTSNQYNGLSFQDMVAKSCRKLYGQELGNCYNFEDINVYFSCDIVTTDNKIIETKNIFGSYKDYTLKMAILQCAVYKTFVELVGRELYTSKFYQKEKNISQHIRLAENFKYFLVFGHEIFEINVINRHEIKNFYLSKIIASLDYTKARIFDDNNKHKEFDILSNYFNYQQIK